MISSTRVVITATSAATTTRTLSSFAAASALVISSTPRLHLPQAAATSSTHHHRHCYSSGGQHYGQDIVLDLQRSNNIRPNPSSCDMSQSIIPPSSDCNDDAITTTASSASSIDIEDIHRHAIINHQTTYIDPITNYTVFTELAHLKRGICCGNICRHCPYGYVNVRRPIPIDDTTTRRRNMPRAVSGDQTMTSRLVQRIMNGTYYNDENDEENEEASSTADANKSTSSTTPTVSQSIATSNKQSIVVVGSGKGGYDGGTFTIKNVPYTRKGDTGTAQLFTGECRNKDDALFDALGTVDELCSMVGLVHAHLTTTTTTVTVRAETETAESNSNHNNKYGELPNQLLDVMSRLFDVGSHIAKPTPPQQLPSNDNATTSSSNNNNYSGYDFSHSTTILEEWIDNMTNELPELLSFIIPTGSIVSAQLHVARTVCRRAERCMVPLVIATAKSLHHRIDNQVDDTDDDDSIIETVERTIDPDALAYINRLSDYFFTAARYVNYCDGIDEVQYRAIGEERRRSSVNTPTSTTTAATTHRERVVVKLKK